MPDKMLLPGFHLNTKYYVIYQFFVCLQSYTWYFSKIILNPLSCKQDKSIIVQEKVDLGFKQFLIRQGKQKVSQTNKIYLITFIAMRCLLNSYRICIVQPYDGIIESSELVFFIKLLHLKIIHDRIDNFSHSNWMMYYMR